MRPCPPGGHFGRPPAGAIRSSFLSLSEVMATGKWDLFAHLQQYLYLSRGVAGHARAGNFALESAHINLGRRRNVQASGDAWQAGGPSPRVPGHPGPDIRPRLRQTLGSWSAWAGAGLFSHDNGREWMECHDLFTPRA